MFNFMELFKLANYAFNPYAIPNLVSAIFLLALGIFVFIKNRRSMANLSFLAIGLSCCIWLFGIALCYLSVNETVAFFWSKFEYLGVSFISPSTYALSVYSYKLKKQKKFVALNYLVGLGFFIFVLKTDYVISGVYKHFWGFYPRFNYAHPFFLLNFFVLMLASFLNFHNAYKEEKLPLLKKRRQYIFVAMMISYIGSVDYLGGYGIAVYPFGYLAVSIFVSFMAYAIVRYRLKDMETIIHRIITYVLLSVAIFLCYVLVFSLTKLILGGAIKIEEILATGFFILVFLSLLTPLKNKIQQWVDRLFYKDKYDYRKTLENFAKKLSLFLDSPNLLPAIISTIAEAMHIEDVVMILFDQTKGAYVIRERNGLNHNQIALKREDLFMQFLQAGGGIIEKELLNIDPKFRQVKQEGLQLLENIGAELIIPLIVQSGLIGILGLGKKLSKEAYRTEDINLLSTIGQEIAVAINNRLLYEDLEKANQKLKEAQAQLVQSAKMAAVGQLGAGVAHELNNPLGGILGYAQFMLEKLKRPEFSPEDFQSCAKYIESIERESTRCKGIVETLLKFSRRPLSIKPEPVDVALAINETLAIIGHQLKLKNVNVVTDLQPALAQVMGITNQLQQVFTNIILNAQQAMPEGGQLKIAAKNIADAHKAEIEFTDSGCGISEENLLHIFEPFFTTKQKDKGTGLGLALSYQIIQDHKGVIEIKSQVGKGTTVKIILPTGRS